MGGMGGMPGMGGMGGMPGMGGMGGMPGMDGMPGMGMDDPDFDEWKISSLEKEDVGKSFDVTGDKGLVMKKLLEPGADFSNPRAAWEVRAPRTRRAPP